MPAILPLSSLSIVLPCRNEAPNVSVVLREALSVAERVANRFEVVVVDDASTDATAERVARWAAADERVRLVRRRRSRGYGAALRTGLLAARGEWVFYTDGDGQFPMEQLPRFLASLADAEVVVGYRRSRHDAPGRRWLGRGWTLLVNATLGLALRDVNCAFKVFPRELFERVALRCDGAGIDAELMAAVYRFGWQVAQVPVEHRPRRAGRASGGRPDVAVRAVGELLALMARWPVLCSVGASGLGAGDGNQPATRLRPDRFAP